MILTIYLSECYDRVNVCHEASIIGYEILILWGRKLKINPFLRVSFSPLM